MEVVVKCVSDAHIMLLYSYHLLTLPFYLFYTSSYCYLPNVFFQL